MSEYDPLGSERTRPCPNCGNEMLRAADMIAYACPACRIWWAARGWPDNWISFEQERENRAKHYAERDAD